MGWIFTQGAAERDYIMSSEEIQQIAALQDELGPDAVTGVVSVAAPEEDEDGPSIHFEVCPTFEPFDVDTPRCTLNSFGNVL